MLDQLHYLYLANVALLWGCEVYILTISKQKALDLVLTCFDFFTILAHKGFSVVGLERGKGFEA